jgi:hypothetical protein
MKEHVVTRYAFRRYIFTQEENLRQRYYYTATVA